MKILNWCVVTSLVSPYTPPELGEHRLSGDIYKDAHPGQKFRDGSTITTSRIVGKKGDAVVTLSGSIYELGNPAPLYEEQFPNAKQRLLDSLEEVK